MVGTQDLFSKEIYIAYHSSRFATQPFPAPKITVLLPDDRPHLGYQSNLSQLVNQLSLVEARR